MVAVLGKRKRRVEITAERPQQAEEAESDNEAMRAAFKRAFEAKFQPLEEVKPASPLNAHVQILREAEGEEQSEFSGFSSEDEEEENVEVVEVATVSRHRTEGTIRSEQRKFMSSKPPISITKIPPTTKSKKPPSDSDDEGEAVNLKKDRELQQLLRESHLLDRTSSTSLNPTGKNRHKAIDLRIQGLGSKVSVFKQEKMPASHRKGIVAKAKNREDTRRKEAKENGIVLERPQIKKGRDAAKKRDRGVGGPAVGRFKGGTLSLSKGDIRDIVGSRGKGKGKRR
ncbi:hypothetical protein EJ05DRAFT_502444 [Pseudovirgaria hyperparasitica]|uniref:Protein FAF1 n=1 Tax=Pseudovirgaria hyperparasitica TaxID=470096 RepID=A0A6A6W203_9PEZI|nr:uncharacterized protein EJ05DRAFT_502444 [Pseudovirgaria hyperparasitica]KAF2755970.1 hypothetical protein EJ05DRAFT_502444 [Pseudovirgaria hyperparasitica]